MRIYARRGLTLIIDKFVDPGGGQPQTIHSQKSNLGVSFKGKRPANVKSNPTTTKITPSVMKSPIPTIPVY